MMLTRLLAYWSIAIACALLLFGLHLGLGKLRRLEQRVLAALILLGYASLLRLLLAIAVGTLVGGIYALPFLAVSVLAGLWLVAPLTLSPE